MLIALLAAMIHPGVGTQTVAQATPQVQVYHTQIRGRFEAFGYTGVMRLTFSANGYVNGTYRPDTGGRLTTVHGGRQGSKIWLDIATLGGIHIEGTLQNGVISGYGAPLGPKNKQYAFTATLQSSPSP
jgi:hypothetical protein